MRKISLLVLVLLLTTLILGCVGTTTAYQTATETLTETASVTSTLTITQPVTTTRIISQPITTTRTVTAAIRCNKTVPDDFDIIYETSWGSHDTPGDFMVLLDTKNNVIGKPLTPPDRYISTDFYISCEDLQALYDAIIKYDIKSYSSPDLLTIEGIWGYPSPYYRISFHMDGEFYSVLFDSLVVSNDFGYTQNMTDFNSFLRVYYWNTNEYKSLPPWVTLI